MLEAGVDRLTHLGEHESPPEAGADEESAATDPDDPAATDSE